MFFVANKKDATCQYYFFSDGGQNLDLDSYGDNLDSNPSLIPLSSFEGQSECQGMSFIPRRCIDSNEGELVRALRFNGKQAEFISFKMPKRFGQVQLSPETELEQ